MFTGLDRNSSFITNEVIIKVKMCKLIALPLTLCSVLFGLTDCTSSFDQRQTGDLNVQIGLKNIQLIALLKGGNEEYVDYDYAYDYSEMTIKPQNGTTPKPLNVTNTQNQSNVTYASTTLAENTTEPSVIATEQRINSTDSLENIINQTAEMVPANYTLITSTSKVTVDVPTTVSPESSSRSSGTPVVSASNCRRGFILNNQGKCEYKIHGTSNALRRIVKLAQKIKIGREYKET